MDVTIRKAEIEDLKAMQELNLILFQKEAKDCTPTLTLEWTFSEKGTDYFKRTIEEECGLALVAVMDEKVVGYLAGWIWQQDPCRTVKISEIENMLILEEFRDKGIGSKLVQEFIKWSKDKEVEVARVGAFIENTETINFYRKNGFEDHELILEMALKNIQ